MTDNKTDITIYFPAWGIVLIALCLILVAFSSYWDGRATAKRQDTLDRIETILRAENANVPPKNVEPDGMQLNGSAPQ